MRKIIVLLVAVLFVGCQSLQIPKKTSQTEPTPEPVNPEQLTMAINQCLASEDCAPEINAYLASLQPQEVTDTQGENGDAETAEEELPEEHINGEAEIDPAIGVAHDYSTHQPLLNNPRVQAALNEWLTWKRPKLVEAWVNYQFLRKRIWPYFQNIQFPEPLLLGIITQESGGRVHSMSSAGASGLFQLMPATASRFGVKGTIGDYDARYHPESAAKGTANYLKEQQGLYGDDYPKILAAYNSGENRIRRLNKKYNNQDVWTPSFYNELPSQTRDYIPKVLAAMLIFENPEKYNVDLQTVDTSSTLIQVIAETSLSELAVCFGQYDNNYGWYRILRNLNASVKAKRNIKANSVVVIPNILKPVYDQQCHTSELQKLAKKMHASDFPERPRYISYTIKAGDNIGGIARKFKCTTKQQIASLNKIKAPRYLIRAGKKLKIPQC
ncbi:transglycosylase SLT domain-containing protein [Marinicella sp. W31]|uniref:transglycosylase SLT domain-containing protein n=1 Tax=Marinicella sp. W31 TaxID=3023713 RepID=UPI003756A880